MTLVYLDTCITSGYARQALDPSEELDAVNRIYRLAADGHLKAVLSNVNRQEEGRATRPAVRDLLAAHADDVPRVAKDHRLLGVNIVDYGYRGVYQSPIITDVVDDDLFAVLQAVGLKANDARHVMKAFVNDCHYFVTVDTRDILPRRTALEAICTPMKIMRPTELVAALNN